MSRQPASEPLVAARNAVTLGLSLATTGALGLVLKLAVPRLLGPHAFGEYRLAESAAELLLIVLTFGVDGQLRMEAALDSARARSAVTGLMVLRIAAGVAVSAAIAAGLWRGSNPGVVALFLLMAVVQVLLSMSGSLTALEHAGDVRWVARLNTTAKAISTVLTIAILAVLPSATFVILVAIAVELLRLIWLATRSSHPSERSLDWRRTFEVVRASAPLFLNLVTHSLYARIGIAWLAASGGATAVGLLGAAGNLAAVVLVGMPLVSGVLLPSAARAGARSEAELTHLMANTLRVALLVSVPIALGLALAGGPLLRLTFGESYVAAAPLLRILAPTCVSAYAATICAIALIQRGRVWSVTAVSVGGAAAMIGFNVLLSSPAARAAGLSSAEATAWATLLTEVCVTLAMAVLAFRWLRDRALLRTIVALTAATGAAVAASGHVTSVGEAWAPVAAFSLALLLLGGITRRDLAFAKRLSVPVAATPRAVAVAALLACLVAVSPAAAQGVGAQPPLPGYVIGVDDVIEISYWREKELSAEVTVRPDGRVSLPLLGEVTAAGATPLQLTTRIREMARELLEAPEITVVVKQINSLKVTITGEVLKPGRYALTSQTTVVELIAMAGGFTEFAHASNIGVLRNVNGVVTPIKIDYRKIASLKDLSGNIVLRSGDIIVVP